jgi:hypothetical protein
VGKRQKEKLFFFSLSATNGISGRFKALGFVNKKYHKKRYAFSYSRERIALGTVKSSYKNEVKSRTFFKMAHFTSQNGPFCSPK